MFKKIKKTLALVMVVAMMLSSVAYAASSNRLSGSDRYATGLKISSEWESAPTVVLAYGEDFPDALSAVTLAKKFNAPVLLTDKNNLPAGVMDELTRLGTKNVYIVGGEGVVSAAVATAVSNAGVAVTRLAGANRYATALAVANEVGATDTVVVANGENFPDALSIAPIAAAKGWPILLTDVNAMDPAVKAFIGTKKVIVVGGTGVVSDAAVAGLSVTRLGGADRYATNVAVMTQFAADLKFAQIYLAYGENFPDALAGAALAAMNGAPVVLVGTSMPAATSSFLAGKASADSEVVALGGSAVVNDGIVNSLVNSLGGGALVVNKVTATTTAVNDDQDNQKLAFTINNGTASDVDTLEAAGYTVELQATKDIFVGTTEGTSEDEPVAAAKSRTGEVDEWMISSSDDSTTDQSVATDGTYDSFSYKVVISKDGTVVAESDLQDVDVTAYGGTTSSIISGKLSKVYDIVADADTTAAEIDAKDAVELESGKVSLYDVDETADVPTLVAITDVKAYKYDGEHYVLDDDPTVQFESSNNSVATVSDIGVITPFTAGSATITMTSGGTTKTFPITVVSKARKATKVTFDKSSLKLAKGADLPLFATVTDQYGDPVYDYTLKDNTSDDGALKDSAVIANLTTVDGYDAAINDEDGEFTIIVEATTDSGKATYKVQDQNEDTIGSIAITVETANDPTTTKKFEKLNLNDDLELDFDTTPVGATTFDGGADDDVLYLVYNKYDKDGRFMGRAAVGTDDTTTLQFSTTVYTLDTSDNQVAIPEVVDASAAVDADLPALTGAAVRVHATTDEDAATNNSGDPKEGSTTIKVLEGKIVRASMNVTVSDGRANVKSVTWNSFSAVKYGSLGAFSFLDKVVRPENLKLDDDSLVVFEISADEPNTINVLDEDDVIIAKVKVTSSVRNSDGDLLTVGFIGTDVTDLKVGVIDAPDADHDATGAFLIKDKGQIVIKVTNEGDDDPVATKVITVNQ